MRGDWDHRFRAASRFSDFFHNLRPTAGNRDLGDLVKPRHDQKVLDPPSFTCNRASVQEALRGDKEPHLHTLPGEI